MDQSQKWYTTLLLTKLHTAQEKKICIRIRFGSRCVECSDNSVNKTERFYKSAWCNMYLEEEIFCTRSEIEVLSAVSLFVFFLSIYSYIAFLTVIN